MSENVKAENTTAKRGPLAKFHHWYGSYAGKTTVNIVYSAGASVVIIGAMFKIMHFPGAGPILMAGMITEAFLFLIGVLEKPHPEYNWDNVFPQLLEYGAPEKRLAKAQVALGIQPDGGGVIKKTNVPSLSDADMTALKDGINDLAKTAVQLSDLSKVATSTTKLGEKMDAAAVAAEQFAVVGKSISEKSEALGQKYTQVAENMAKVVDSTKVYGSNVEAITTNLSSLNAVYELQLKAVQGHVDAYKAQTDKLNAASAQVDNMTAQVSKMAASAEGVAKSQEVYEVASKKLAEQVASLNKIYGNMLNALA